MPAPAFFAFAIALGALTVGATATDAKRWMGTDQRNAAALKTFYSTRFTSPADCLNGAVSAGAPLDACAFEEGDVLRTRQPSAAGPGATTEAVTQPSRESRYTSLADCLNDAVITGTPPQRCGSEK